MSNNISGPGSEENYSDTDLSRNEIFDLMSNYRRRSAIFYCKQANGSVSLSDLADQVTAWEHDKEVSEITSSERKTVYTSLQQTHLPRLERAGMIDFDGDEITLTDRIELLDIYLDVVPANSVSWGIYYLGLSVLSCLVLIGLWMGFLPTQSIPVLLYPTVIVLAFLISATYHAYLNREYRFENLDQPI